MRTEILLMLVAIGLGTYALRALPLIGARRLDPAGKVFRTLQLLGPMLIAALLGVSVIGDASRPQFTSAPAALRPSSTATRVCNPRRARGNPQ